MRACSASELRADRNVNDAAFVGREDKSSRTQVVTAAAVFYDFSLRGLIYPACDTDES